MGRNPEVPIKKLIGFDQKVLDAIERYRASQIPIPNQSEAIRRIIAEWLREHEWLKD